jgi:hypothetical protein
MPVGTSERRKDMGADIIGPEFALFLNVASI